MRKNAATSSKALNRQKVLELAERYLARHRAKDYSFVLSKERIQRHDDWWYVEVLPSREDVSVGEFTNRIVDAELELQGREGANVILTNMLPRDVMAVDQLAPRLAATLGTSPRRQMNRKAV